MVALDGQQFADQSEETRLAFTAIHGENAERAWEYEHEAGLPASDGQEFRRQTAETIGTFRAVWGDAAARRWIAEHNEALGPPPDPHWDVVDAEADEGNSRYGALVLAFWPRWSGLIDGIRYHNSPVIKAQTSREKGEVGYWFVGWLVDRGYDFPVGSAWIMRVDGFCRVYEASRTDPESALRFVEYSFDGFTGDDQQISKKDDDD